MKKNILILLCMLIASIIHSQHSNDSFTFRFTDSSVPPPYHRSYTIQVDDSQVQFSIDSYGDVLLNETYKIDSTQYHDFVQKIQACKLKDKLADKDTEGCTGGTTDAFTIKYANNKGELWGYVYHCGGKDYGNIRGKIAEAKDLFKSMVPDFGVKLASTENK